MNGSMQRDRKREKKAVREIQGKQLDKLKLLDELTLIEILDISSEELVDAFSEKANDKLEQLQEDFRHETQ